MPTTKLSITAGAMEFIGTHHFRGDGAEHLSFLPVGVRRTPDGLELLAAEVWPVSDDDLVGGANPAFLELKPGAMVEIVNRAVRAGVGLIEVHNHGEHTERCTFSWSDHDGFRRVVPYMMASLGVKVYGALVVAGPDDLDGLLWTPGGPAAQLDVVRVVGPQPRSVRATRSSLAPDPVVPPDEGDLVRFDRQVRAFGNLGQARLRTLHVGLVGVGGLGSIIAQQLARAGVGEFTPVDHDRVDATSLNRLDGATVDDAARRKLKVDVAARQIHAANPAAKVHPLPLSVFAPESIAALSGVDLLISATDDSASRFAVNEIALAYLRPLLDLATGITTRDGRLTDAGGRFTFTFPGTGCILCARAIDPREACAEFCPPEVRGAQRGGGYIVGSTAPAPSVMALNGIIACNAAFEVIAWAAGIRAPMAQRYVDALRGTESNVRFQRNERCLVCREMLGLGDLAQLGAKYSTWTACVA